MSMERVQGGGLPSRGWWSGTGLLMCTARWAAVGYGVGDLNRPGPAAVGDPGGRLSVRLPAKAGR
jgi:hypothetical protein